MNDNEIILAGSDFEQDTVAYSETTVDSSEQNTRLFLSTPFEEYTVSEGLLLLLLLFAFISALIRVVKEAFSWV